MITITGYKRTVLMSENRIYDVVSDSEVDAVHGIVLLRNVTELHAQEQKEMEDLRVAYEEAESCKSGKDGILKPDESRYPHTDQRCNGNAGDDPS
mgnify:CR=1 FL=1